MKGRKRDGAREAQDKGHDVTVGVGMAGTKALCLMTVIGTFLALD